MSQYKPYPAYKDSGVEWLGPVPEHWDVLRLGQFGLFSKGSGSTKQDEQPTGVPCIRYGDLYTTHTHFIEGSRSCVAVDRAQDYTPLRYGDILFAASGETAEEIGKSAANLLTADARCGGDIIIFRSTAPVDPKFMGYALDSQPSVFQKSGMGKGYTVVHIYPSQLRNLLLAMPTQSEQRRVAAFLDREAARIDALIEKKQRLIELLKEKRQAVITQAVTKGLDPNVPMKDSGVEWLGEVPEHWDVRRIKHLVGSCEQGWSPQCENRQADALEYGVLKVGCVNGGTFSPSENKALPPDFEPRTQYAIKAGDFLVSRANTKELVGSAAIVEDDWPYLILCDKLYRLRFRGTIDPKYIGYYLRSHPAREQIELSASGASNSMQNIAQAAILDLVIATPPRNEVAMIMVRLTAVLSNLAEIESKTAKSVDLLKEHRSALITAAVTGQIDVRDAA